MLKIRVQRPCYGTINRTLRPRNRRAAAKPCVYNWNVGCDDCRGKNSNCGNTKRSAHKVTDGLASCLVGYPQKIGNAVDAKDTELRNTKNSKIWHLRRFGASNFGFPIAAPNGTRIAVLRLDLAPRDAGWPERRSHNPSSRQRSAIPTKERPGQTREKLLPPANECSQSQPIPCSNAICGQQY